MRLALLLLVAVPALALSQVVEDKMDRFTGERELKYSEASDKPIGTPSFNMSATLSPSNQRISVTFIVANVADRRVASAWKYLRCHDVNWLLDGKAFSLGASVHSGQVVRGGVIELVTQVVTREQLEQMAAADGIEYRICNDEYRLSQFDLTAIRSISKKVGEAPAVSSQEPATARE